MAEPIQSKQVPISALSLFSKSSQLVQNNLSTFAILYIIPVLANLGQYAHHGTGDRARISTGFGGLPSIAIGSILGLGIVLFIAFIVFSIITSLMLQVLELRTANGKKPTLGELWLQTKKYGPRLFGLGFVVGLYVLLGFIMLIVPGLIFIRRYFLSAYVLMDQDVSISEAMKISAEMTKPYSGSIWGIIGVSILLSLTGVIPVIGWVISLVLSALYSVAPALRYYELKGMHEPTQAA